jgi:hypothetical protein
MAKRDQKDEPWSDNYPPLRAWLHSRVFERGGHCVSQDFGPKRRYAIEQYHVHGTLVLVLVLADRRGWDAFVPVCKANSIADTLAALDVAVGFTADDPDEPEPRAIHTACRHCGLDIEGWSNGDDWRDRGNNDACPLPRFTRHAPAVDPEQNDTP